MPLTDFHFHFLQPTDTFVSIKQNCMSNHSYKKILAGIILVLVGKVLLLHNLHLLPVELPSFVFTWKMILVVAGVYFILIGSVFMGFILIGTAGYFLLPEAFGIYITD